MRFDIKKLESKGFHVSMDEESVAIIPPPMPQAAWGKLKAMVEATGIVDPALQEYAIGAFAVAVQRAQILEMAE